MKSPKAIGGNLQFNKNQVNGQHILNKATDCGTQNFINSLELEKYTHTYVHIYGNMYVCMHIKCACTHLVVGCTAATSALLQCATCNVLHLRSRCVSVSKYLKGEFNELVVEFLLRFCFFFFWEFSPVLFNVFSTVFLFLFSEFFPPDF